MQENATKSAVFYEVPFVKIERAQAGFHQRPAAGTRGRPKLPSS